MNDDNKKNSSGAGKPPPHLGTDDASPQRDNGDDTSLSISSQSSPPPFTKPLTTYSSALGLDQEDDDGDNDDRDNDNDDNCEEREHLTLSLPNSNDNEENMQVVVIANESCDDEMSSNNDEKKQGEQKKDTPLPWGALSIVLFIFLTDSFNQTTLGPYISDMIIHMGLVPDGDKRKIGRYSGILSTCYYVAQFFSAYIWGLASDRYGRRPILLSGIVGSSISSLMFGFSSTFWWAIMSRSLFGVLNGNLGVYKTYLAEISDKSNQARVFTFMAVTFSVGSIIGPLLSGLTSDPLKQYPNSHNILPSFIVSILTKFPFLLPNLILSVLSFIAFFFGLYFLKETNKVILQKRNSAKEAKQQKEQQQQEQEQQQEEEEEQLEQQTDIELNELEEQQKSVTEVMTTVEDHDDAVAVNEEEKELTELDVDGQSLFDQNRIKEQPARSMRWYEYIKQKLKLENEIFQSYAPMATVAMYSVHGFVTVIVNELMPLWLVLKVEDGGLAFVQRQIGIMNAVSFVFLLLWSLLAVPRIIKRFGSLYTFRAAAVLAAIPISLTPTVNFVASYKVLSWAYVIFLYVWRHSFFQALFASVTIMGNNSVSSANMGRLNGISQSGVALTRAIGPVVGTSLFAWSLSVNVFPINVYFMFFVLSFAALSLNLWTLKMPKSVNSPRNVS